LNILLLLAAVLEEEFQHKEVLLAAVLEDF
jgi:hypothetical protein